MKKLREGRTILTIFLLAFALYFVISAVTYGRNSRIFPLAIGAPTALLTALALVAVWQPGLLRRARVDLGPAVEEGEDADPETGEEARDPTGRILVMVGWLLLALAAVGLVGFRVAVPLYVLFFARFQGRAKWTTCVAAAILVWAFILGYFEFVMEFRMFRGILFGDFLPVL